MTVGSSYSTVKAAIIDALADVPDLADVTILPAPPADTLAVRGRHGSGKTIWLADAEVDLTNEVIYSAGVLALDETLVLTVVFQALARTSSDTQAVTDQAVDEMLGAFLTVMATDPTWGVTAFPVCQTTYGQVRRFAGPVAMGDNPDYPSRAELDLVVEARLVFGTDQ